MDSKLTEINHILYLVEKMIEYIQNYSIIHPENDEYMLYKQRLKDFCKQYDVKKQYPAIYNVLDFYYYESSSYYVDMTEAQNIRKAVTDLKNAICPNNYEKFLSVTESVTGSRWKRL